MSYIAVFFLGFAGKAVEHGCPPLPQTGRFSYCSCSTGQRTHIKYTHTYTICSEGNEKMCIHMIVHMIIME